MKTWVDWQAIVVVLLGVCVVVLVVVAAAGLRLRWTSAGDEQEPLARLEVKVEQGVPCIVGLDGERIVAISCDWQEKMGNALEERGGGR